MCETAKETQMYRIVFWTLGEVIVTTQEEVHSASLAEARDVIKQHAEQLPPQ